MKKFAVAGMVSVLALISATDALAQAAKPAQAVTDGDIVVTATRTETLLSKTPIAMTAVSGEQLVTKGITNTTQLADSVPNVSIVRGNGLQITIRGVTSTDGTEKGDPSAAFLLDGIYLARPQAQEVSFFDVERVEVLRGPQGTLYGRNTTAGVVNVISASPKQKFGASVDASYESFNHVNATAMVNVPVSETFAMRAAVNYDRRDSYVGKASTDNFSWGPFRDVFAARVSALWTPSSAVKLLVKADYSLDGGYGVNSVPTSNFFSTAAASPSAGVLTNPSYLNTSSAAQRTSNLNEQWQGKNHTKGNGIMGQLDWNLSDNLTATYLASYRTFNRYSLGTLARSATTGNRTTFVGDYWQTSHEARLAYRNGAFTAQAGGYYFKEQSGIAFFILDFFGPNSQFGFPQDPTKAVSKGAFGQASYNFTDRLKLTAGVRYSSDLKSRVGATVNDNLLTGARTTFQINNASRTFSKTTWRVGLDYDVPGLGLFYANVATGYKAGGFNDGCETGTAPGCALPGNALYYQPETLTAFETGFKIHTADYRLRLNGNYFHYDYNGLQVSSVQNVCGGPCQVTANAATAKVDGLELEAVIRPADNHLIDASVTLLDARYGNYTPPINGANANFAGVQLNRSPKSVVSLGYTYTQPLGNGGDIQFNAKTRISASYALTDVGNGSFFRQPNYSKSDLTLTYNAPSKAYYVGLFAKNLENRIVITGATANGTFLGTASFEDPRTFGIRAGTKF
jgi:iron complex outermembrane receptor protein